MRRSTDASRFTALTTATLLAGSVGGVQAQTASGRPTARTRNTSGSRTGRACRSSPSASTRRSRSSPRTTTSRSASPDRPPTTSQPSSPPCRRSAPRARPGRPASSSWVAGTRPSPKRSTSASPPRCPTAVTDGDLFQSDRLTYVGTDWYQLGCRMAERQIAEHQARGLTGGEVAVISPFNIENMERSQGLHPHHARGCGHQGRGRGGQPVQRGGRRPEGRRHHQRLP